jgi:hypothetical protein
MLDRELILQAHDLLHKGDVKGAHEALHKALGVDNDAPEASAPMAHRMGFDSAFRTACRKNGVRAMYVLVDSQDATGNARILSGGDAELCQFVDGAMRGAKHG